MGSTNVGHRKGYKGLPMEGPIAHWYSRLRVSALEISRSFVKIASRNALQAQVSLDVRLREATPRAAAPRPTRSRARLS